jgi:hypothetical protein
MTEVGQKAVGLEQEKVKRGQQRSRWGGKARSRYKGWWVYEEFDADVYLVQHEN